MLKKVIQLKDSGFFCGKLLLRALSARVKSNVLVFLQLQRLGHRLNCSVGFCRIMA